MPVHVSDVQIAAHKMRRPVMVQGILELLFNTSIQALTVNIAAELV